MKLLFPKNADNGYTFSSFVVVMFSLVTLVTLVTLGRSLAHLFLPDGGANSIATIMQFEGSPDPDKVIYFIFALWGLSQLLMGIFYLIVLIRYKNLIPLMWVFILTEYSMRIVIQRLLKPLGDAYLTGTAPGEIGNYLMIPVAVSMLVLSFVTKRKSASAG